MNITMHSSQVTSNSDKTIKFFSNTVENSAGYLKKNKIMESERALLISGILIALKNKAFRQSYRSHPSVKQLTANLLATIEAEFENAGIPPSKMTNLAQPFSFLKTLPVEKPFVEDLIKDIDDNINTFRKNHEYYDNISQFYVEFLRYANNDKGTGYRFDSAPYC